MFYYPYECNSPEERWYLTKKEHITHIKFIFYSYKLLVVGGGAGGCATAAKFASKLGKGNVGVIEPAEVRNPVFFVLSKLL